MTNLAITTKHPAMLRGGTLRNLEVLVQALGLPMFVLDGDFVLVHITESAARWDGRPIDRLLGRSFWELWPGLVDADYGRAVREVVEDKATRIVEIHHVGETGVERWSQSHMVPWGDGMIGVSKDITEQKQLELALSDATRRFELASRASDDIIYEWDVASDGSTWNEEAARRFGTVTPSFSWWRKHLHPEDLDRVETSLNAALAGQATSWSGEYRLRTKDGSYATFMDRCFILRNEQGEAVKGVGALVDLTAQQDARREVIRLQNDLIHVARTSAMGNMAATMAHEINQPLTAVLQYLGGCERILDATPHSETTCDQMKEAIGFARGAAERAAEVIKRVRSLSVKQEAHRESICVDAAVNEAMNLALLGVRRGDLAVEVDIDPGLGVLADSVEFQQVMMNLIRNAVQAMEQTEQPCLNIRAYRDGRDGVIEVSDNGPGVPKDHRASLFDSFFSTKADGMGMGLSVSRTIVERYQGKLELAETETGAKFVIRLRLAEEDDSPVQVV